MKCGVGAPPSRLWLLEVGVVGVMISEVLRLPVLDASATPVSHVSVNKDMAAISYTRLRISIEIQQKTGRQVN